MLTKWDTYTEDELLAAKEFCAEAINSQAIEDNPLTEYEIVMAYRSVRDNWSDEKYTEYVKWSTGLPNNFDPSMQ